MNIKDNPTFTMTSKKRGKCASCGKMINPGERIVWDSDNFRAFHAACLQVVQPAAPPPTSVVMMITPGDKAWYVPLAYEQVSERKAVKEAGFQWHGPDRCDDGHCFPCHIGVPRKAWFTTDFPKANRLRSYATPQALAAIDKLLETERKSEAAEPSGKSQRDIPIPAGLSYYPCQLAGIEWLQENHRTMIADEPGVGKGQPVDSMVLTPSGWKRMGDIRVGDHVIGSNGKPTQVIGVYPRGELETFKVTFNDKTSLVVDGEHLWNVKTANDNFRGDPWRTIDTLSLSRDVRTGSGICKWRIPMVSPVEFDAQDIPCIDPYVLGVLLGDGGLTACQHSVMFTPGDMSVPAEVEKVIGNGFTVHRKQSKNRCDNFLISDSGFKNRIKSELKRLGLWGVFSEGRFIPDIYLFNSIECRLSVLQGLLDTDGSLRNDSVIEFCSASKRLVEQVAFICESFGGVARIGAPRIGKYKKDGKVIECKMSYRVRLSFPPHIVPLRAHANRYIPKTKYQPSRVIRSIEGFERKEIVCIRVEAEDQLYVTEHFIVTHNTLQVLGLLNAEPRIRKTLILVQATVCRNWVREAARFLVVPTLAKVLYSSEDMHDIIVASQNQPVIGVTNYEKLVKGRGKGMLESIKSFDWDLIVVDEIHKLKNPKAAMSKAIIGSVKEPGIFRTIPRAIALTGTPVPNETIELWPIISSLRPDVWKSIFSFGNRYTAKPKDTVPIKGRGPTEIWVFEGGKNEQELQTKLRSGGLMLRRLKSEVLKELPPKRRRVFALDPDSPDAKRAVKAQAAIYDRYDAVMTNAAVSQLSGDTGAFADQLAEIRRGEKADFQEMAKIRAMLGEAKIEPAISHISELLDSGTKKIVVFTHHQKVQDGLIAGLKSYNMVTILGRDSEKKRDNSVQAFQNDPSVRICLCSTLASGVGITLTAASHIVFVEFDWVPGNVVQAEDRCHRIGQSEPVVIDYLAFDETLDQRMAELIVEKLHLADAILDRKRQAGKQVTLDPSLGQPIYLMPDVEQLAVKPCPAHVKALLFESIQQLAEVCDGARQKDGMGFSGNWAEAGHRLARRSEFTDQEARLAKRIVLHHRKQVGIDPAQLEW